MAVGWQPVLHDDRKVSKIASLSVNPLNKAIFGQAINQRNQ